MERIKRIAFLSAGIILLTTGLAWVITRDVNTTLVILTLASTLATVIMAVTIYELDIAIRELNFEAISAVYELMDEKVKKDLRDISQWRLNGLSVEDFLKDKEKVQKVRNASKTLNRVGYFVYRNFVGEWFIQEQFGGLILESFLTMKPYLEALRIQSECAEKRDEECIRQPWFMRRFYLLIVVISYKYMAEEFEQQCRELFKKYGYDFALPLPENWLARDVKNWLKKRGYL